MPPKKAAKNTKKAPITPPLPPHEDPKPIIAESSAKQELQLPPPVQEKPHSPAKEPIKEPANPKKTPEKTAETVEEKPNPSPENDNKAVVGVIKLNQFNNFQNVAAAGNKTTGGISEEEKKKLREMRFAGKSVAENTFDVSHVFFLNFQMFFFKEICSFFLGRGTGKTENARQSKKVQFASRR